MLISGLRTSHLTLYDFQPHFPWKQGPALQNGDTGRNTSTAHFDLFNRIGLNGVRGRVYQNVEVEEYITSGDMLYSSTYCTIVVDGCAPSDVTADVPAQFFAKRRLFCAVDTQLKRAKHV